MRKVAVPGLEEGRALTVGQWLDWWLQSRTSPRGSTLGGYRAHIRLYLRPHLGSLLLGSLNGPQVQQAFTRMARHPTASGEPLSGATLHRVHATFRAALNAAVRAGYLSANPARTVKLPSGRRPPVAVWTEAAVQHWRETGQRPSVAVWSVRQTEQFLRAIEDDRLYAAFHLMALRGPRRGGVVGLRWCDVDVNAARLAVTQQVQQYDGALVVCEPKSPTSRRTVALDRASIAVLRRHWSQQRAEATAMGEGARQRLCLHRRPRRGDRARSAQPDLSSAEQESGLPPIRLHDLRHGAATLALAAGVELKVVQQMLGHSSIVLTADAYTSVLPDVAHSAAEETAELVLRDAQGKAVRRRTAASAARGPGRRRGHTRAPSGTQH